MYRKMTRYLAPWKPVDVEELRPLLVTYRPTRLPRSNALHREMLRPEPQSARLCSRWRSPWRLFSTAPNRDAVEQNLRQSIRGFENAFTAFQQIETGHRLGSWQDLLRLNLQHVTKAERHYTNGQATATCVRAVEGLSVGLHANIASVQSTIYVELSLVAHALVLVTTEREAREVASGWLASAKEEDVPVLVDGTPKRMKWRRWGDVPGDHGYRTTGLLLSVEGRSAWTELNEWAGARFEPYAVLNRLPTILTGVEADTCATCRSFRFSGMSRDFSGGWVGYCMHHDRASEGQHPTTSVHERCEHHAMIQDSEREHPYLGLKLLGASHSAWKRCSPILRVPSWRF